MSATGHSAAQLLRAELLKRVSQNPSYSVRAFARDLGISHSYLSQILNGRRRFSLRQAVRVADALRLERGPREDLFRALLEVHEELRKGPNALKAVSSDTVSVDMQKFRVVKDWYHGAIMELASLKSFRPDYQWISKQLGITVFQAKSAVAKLQSIGVLNVKGRKWTKTNRRIQFPTSSLQEAVNAFHQEMMNKALEKLSEKTADDFAVRDITGITIAIDPSRLPEAKRRIQVFRNKLADFLSKGEASQVYQLNVQLFPLTGSRKRPTRRKQVKHAIH